jgi:hypothetical protein
MWYVAAFSKGEWTKVRSAELTGVPPSSQAALGLAEALVGSNQSNLLQYLRQETASSVGLPEFRTSRAAIELWSKDAEAEFHDFNLAPDQKLEAVQEGLAYHSAYEPSAPPSPVPAPVPDSLIWHDRTLVVIPIAPDVEEIAIEYVPDLRDENRVARMRQGASQKHKLETVFEWRGYFGQQSAVIDGWNAMRGHGKNFLTKVRTKAGFLVGFVLRRLSRPQRALDRDPTYASRLNSMIARYPDVAKDIADLTAAPVMQRDSALVFVHGTVSCGIQNLKDLYPAHIRIPTFRFEHDTFRPLQENGAELADLISSRIQARQVYLVGHSRGGLVARVAREKLRKLAYGCPVKLHTFGTPHLGTPLAQIGARLLNVFFRLGGDLLGAIPNVGPLAMAYSYVIDAPGLPPGLDVMREESDVLGLLNETGDSGDADCWASKFDMNAGPSGFGVEIEGLLMGALSSVANDLVVPASSALAFGMARPLLACSHVHYFQQPEVQAFFDSLAAAIPAPGVLATAVGGASSLLPPAPPPPRIFPDGSGHVVVGDVRVSRRV